MAEPMQQPGGTRRKSLSLHEGRVLRGGVQLWEAFAIG